MPDTLCIATLEDGRRALCYLNQEEGRAQLVLVLRPEDLAPRRPPILRNNGRPVPIYGTEGQLLGHVKDGEFTTLPIPTASPKSNRITPEDLLRMEVPRDALSPEERLLRDLQDMAGEDPDQSSLT